MIKPSNPKDAIATDKLALHLVSPIVKAYQAIAHYLGNVKYGAWNWRAAGARASIYKSALDRHIDAWWEGEEFDPVDGTPHLANALACIGILIDSKHAGNLIDDRPPSQHAELSKVRAEFEDMMPRIRARYANMEPKHYTIDDTEAPEAQRFPYIGEDRRKTPRDGSDGMTHWDGRGCPVDLRKMVKCKLRDGRTIDAAFAGALRWEHHGLGHDIVAYKAID